MMKTLKVGEQAQFEYALMDEIVKLQEALEMNQVHALRRTRTLRRTRSRSRSRRRRPRHSAAPARSLHPQMPRLARDPPAARPRAGPPWPLRAHPGARRSREVVLVRPLPA